LFWTKFVKFLKDQHPTDGCLIVSCSSFNHTSHQLFLVALETFYQQPIKMQ